MSPERELELAFEELYERALNRLVAAIAQQDALVAAGGTPLPARLRSLWDQAAWKADVLELVVPPLSTIFHLGVSSVDGARSLRSEVALRLHVRAIEEWGQRYASWTSSAAAAARAVGGTVEDLIEEVGSWWAGRASYEDLAASMASGAWNAGSLAGLQSAGIQGLKTWRTMGDDRVRSAHAELEGVSVPIAAAFRMRGHDVTYPGDPTLPIGLRINCRCRLEFSNLRAPAGAQLSVGAFAKKKASGWRTWCEKNPDRCRGRSMSEVEADLTEQLTRVSGYADELGENVDALDPMYDSEEEMDEIRRMHDEAQATAAALRADLDAIRSEGVPAPEAADAVAAARSTQGPVDPGEWGGDFASEREARAWYVAHGETWDVDPDQAEEALDAWFSDYRNINEHLRGERNYPAAQTATQRIDALIETAPKLDRDVTTWRALEADGWAGKFKPGDVIANPGYQATTVSERFARGWLDDHGQDVGDPVLLEIRLPRGSTAAPVTAPGAALYGVPGDAMEEVELLLPRGVDFRVVGARTSRRFGEEVWTYTVEPA